MASLDGYIAGPNGEYDWIPMDPDFDFSALYARYSAIVMGRKAYGISAGTEGGGDFVPKLPVYVYSRTYLVTLTRIELHRRDWYLMQGR